MTGAQILLKTLSKLNVKTMFGYPGSSILPIYNSLKDFDINCILTAHEQGASFAASGYARATGKAGVVLATSGPGATNLVTGIADAFMDSIPLIAITGNVELKNLGHDCFQEVDIFGITLPIVKYSYIVKETADIEKTLIEAFDIATCGRRGPVLIDIPLDVLNGEAEYKNLDLQRTVLRVDYSNLNSIANLINKCKKPFIYIGGGAISSNASEDILKLAKKLGAKVGVSFMALGTIPFDYENYYGVVCDDNALALSALYDSDLILSLGARFNSRNSAFEKIEKLGTPIIQIDIDGAEIDKNVMCKNYLICDLSEGLKKLEPLIEKRENALVCLPSHTPKGRGIEIISAISKFVPDDTIIVTDVGLHQIWTAKNYPFKLPRTFLTSGGLGVMGFGMGASIGASLATNKKVVLITGDGSLKMNINEFETAVRLKLNITVICINNSSLGLIKKLQTKNKNFAFCDLNKLNFAKLAESYGGIGITLNEKDDIDKVLSEALKQNKPQIVDCIISNKEL